MRRAYAGFVIAALCCGSAIAAPPAIPDTPAGHALEAWLEAFNSGDTDRVQAYLKTYEPKKTPEEMIAFRHQTGGFELIGIDKSERTRIEFSVREKASLQTAVGRIEVKDAVPPEVVTFRIRAIPRGMTAADMTMKVDAALRTRVLDGLPDKLTRFYVFPDVARRMNDALAEHRKKGDYDAITDADDLAQTLTEHLRAVSHDLHLFVRFVPGVLPPDDPDPTVDRPPPTAERRAELERVNCGFEKVERFPSNVGYLKFNFFGDPNVCGPTATAAIGLLAHVDALIVDMRENGGGDPRMVAYVTSYLFKERTHLNDLYVRPTNKTDEFWTDPSLPGPKLGDTPVYVLTSKRTVSGAEEFAYSLKNLKRATIVGETTAGGAHPTTPHRLDDHFLIAVPFARGVSPITKTNWEGTGVEPDVKVPAAQALEVAQKMAAEKKLAAKIAPPKVAYELAKTLDAAGASAALARYRELKAKEPQKWDFDENALNDLGYEALQRRKVDDAIEAFRLNVETYPRSFNVYDSLGDAYEVRGDREQAIANYSKSLTLNPDDRTRQHSAEALERLRQLPRPIEVRTLAKYVGTYRLASGGSLVVIREADRLYGRIDGDPRFELIGDSATDFRRKDARGSITFAADGTSLVLHREGRDIAAKWVK